MKKIRCPKCGKPAIEKCGKNTYVHAVKGIVVTKSCFVK